MHVDTQKVHSALVTGGFTVEQADTVIDVMRDIDLSHLATKDDLKELSAATKNDLKELRTATQNDLKEFSITTKNDIKELSIAFNKKIAPMKTDIALLKWGMAILIAGVFLPLIKGMMG